MRRIAAFITALVASLLSYSQVPWDYMKGLKGYPMLYLDSIQINATELEHIDPNTISNVDILFPKTAKRKLGKKASDGVIFIITKGYVQKAYISYFSKQYRKYRELIEKYQIDSSIAYLINGTYYNNHYPQEIYSAIATGISKFKIISKRSYERKYTVLINEHYVVVLKTKKKTKAHSNEQGQTTTRKAMEENREPLRDART